MASLKKTLVCSLLALFLVLLGVGIWLSSVVDKQKGNWVHLVEQRFQFELPEEKIAVKLFPFIGFRIFDVSTENIRIPRADFHIRLLSLLRRRIEGDLYLDSAEFTIHRATNLPSVSRVLEIGKSASSEDLPFPIQLGKINVRKGKVIFEQRTSEAVSQTLEGLNCEIRELNPSDPSRPMAVISVPSFSLKSLNGRFPLLQKTLPLEFKYAGPVAIEIKIHRGDAGIALTGTIDLKETFLQYGDIFSKPPGSELTLSFVSRSPMPDISVGSYQWVLSSKKLGFWKFSLTDFKMAFKYSGAVTYVDNLEFGLWDGALRGNGTINFKGKKPIWSFDLTMSRFNINTTLREIAGLSGVLTGVGDAELKFKMEGNTKYDNVKSVSWAGTLALQRGALEALSQFGNLGAKTDFERFKATFILDQGTMAFSSIQIEDSAFFVDGKGTMDLDFNLNLNGSYYLSHERLKVPFSLTGSLSRPKVLLDSFYLKELQKS